MKKISLLFITLLIFCSTARGDEKREIYKQVFTGVKKDTVFINLVDSMGTILLATSPDSALVLFNKALDISGQMNYSKGIISSFKLLASYYLQINDQQNGIACYKKALDHARGNKNFAAQVEILNELGSLNKRLTYYEESMKCYLEALKINEIISDKPGIAASYYNLGDLYWYMKKYDAAMEYYNKGLNTAKGINSDLLMGKGIGSIGRTYYYKRDYKTAIGFLLQAKTLLEKTNNKKQIANNYNNIGLAYVRLKQFELAKEYHEKALEIRKEIKDNEGILISLANIGEMNYYSGNKTEALKLYKEAEKLALDLKMGYALKTIYGSILNIYKDFSDFKSAYLYHEKYIALDDSIYNADIFKKIRELNTKYEVEKKDLELRKNQAVIYASLAVITTFLVFMVILVILYQNKKKLNRLLTDRNLKIETQNTEIINQRDEMELLNDELKIQKEIISGQRDRIEAELKETVLKSDALQKENILFQYEALKNQVNPHFLFNNFSTLVNLIPENPKLAENYVHHLSSVYRYILTTSTARLQELSFELEFIRSYMFLVEIRFDNNINISVNIEEEYLSYYIPLLSLQLLIENAIKHNIVSAKRKLNISILNEKDILIVRNTLQKKNTVEESTKIGLQNIIKRFALVTERKVEITEDEKEFSVKIPLLKSNGNL